MIESDTGLLLNAQNIKLQRKYFEQFLKLRGLKVLFRAPRENLKQYNSYGELDARYQPAVETMCIYDEHPSQKSMRKLGWDSQLNDTTTVIHVPYDLPGVQTGALFIIPSGLDNTRPNIFRVARMTNIAIYPASIACELIPEWENTMEASETTDFRKSNFNVLFNPDEVDEDE